jgi:peptidoglycan pentaglycine glycine transferase (the first glycine)
MVEVGDRRDWDRLVLQMASPHVLQSAAWGEFKSRWGWQVWRFAWLGPSGPAAAAQVLVRRLGGLPLSVGYVPKGPLLADDEACSWSQPLGDLAAWASRRRLALLKVDPDVPAERQDVAAAWRSVGLRPSAEQIQFPNTMRSDLAGGETALRAQLKPKTRYNIGLAARRGVAMRLGGMRDLAAFYDLYAETGNRDGFAVRERAYYEDVWTQWLGSGSAALILAERNGAPLAGALPVRFGRTAWFLYGACLRYDWWGGPTRLEETDRLWGVYRFKSGFGARLCRQLGAWDAPATPLLYSLYGELARLRRAWLGRSGRAARNGPNRPLRATIASKIG